MGLNLVGTRSNNEAFGSSAKDYIRAHWLGQQSLAWSFWVNLALLRAVIIAMEELLRGPLAQNIYVEAIVVPL